MSCDKCLRLIGLWIYRTEANLYDNKFQKNYTETTSDDTRLSYLNEIQFYSDELVVEDVLKSIVNRIEVNSEAQLKTTVDDMATNEQQSNPGRRKRKFSHSTGDDEQHETSKRKCQSDYRPLNNTKLFDPVHEHFSWCPWQAKTSQLSSSNVSSVHFDIIKRYLIKLKDSSNQLKSNDEPKKEVATSQFSTSSPFNNAENRSELTSEMLLQKIKSVQSLLINCTSNYSSKQS